jgi:hypothetical protein
MNWKFARAACGDATSPQGEAEPLRHMNKEQAT